MVNAVKHLLEVDEIDEQGNIQFRALLYDVLKSKYMIHAHSAPLETNLFFTEFVVNGTINSVQDNSEENIAGDGKKRDATAVVTFLEVSLLGDLDS